MSHLQQVQPVEDSQATLVQEEAPPPQPPRPRVGLSTISHSTLSVIAVLLGGLLFRTVAYRAIGPAQGGLLALAFSIINIAGIVVSLGLPPAAVKFVAAAESPAERASYILVGCIALLVHSLVVVAVLLCSLPAMALWLKSPDLLHLQWGILLAIPLSALLSFWSSANNGLMQFSAIARLNLVNNISRVLLAVALVNWVSPTAGMALVAAVGGYLLANLWESRLAFTLWRQYGLGGKVRAHAADLYKFGFFQFGTMVLEQIVFNSGVLLTARYLAPREVGLYSTAALLSQVVWVVPSAMQLITYPLMSSYWATRDKATLHHVIRLATITSLVVSAPIVFVLFYLRTDMIQWLFGSSFLGAATPLAILLIGYLFGAVVGVPLGSSMGAFGKPGLDLVRAAIAGIVNLGLNLLLIPRLGVAGAAWAMTGSLIVTSCMAQMFIVNLSGLAFPWQVIRPAAALSAVSILICTLPLEDTSARVAAAIIGGGMLAAAGWAMMSHEDRSFVTKRIRPDPP